MAFSLFSMELLAWPTMDKQPMSSQDGRPKPIGCCMVSIGSEPLRSAVAVSTRTPFSKRLQGKANQHGVSKGFLPRQLPMEVDRCRRRCRGATDMGLCRALKKPQAASNNIPWGSGIENSTATSPDRAWRHSGRYHDPAKPSVMEPVAVEPQEKRWIVVRTISRLSARRIVARVGWSGSSPGLRFAHHDFFGGRRRTSGIVSVPVGEALRLAADGK